jgi:hypothetical protein
MKSTITDSSHRSFVETAKLDHIVWKSEVYAVIHGLSHKSLSDFDNHKSCRLGQWYGNSGMQKYSNNNSFRSLEQPHSDVHNEGVKALEAFKNNNKELTLQSLEKMESASQRVMTYLDEIANVT